MSLDTRVSEQVQLYAEALRADDDNSGARRQGAQLGLRYQASERLTVDLAVRAVHEEGSANGNGLSVAAPVMILSGGVMLTVVAVEASAEGTVWVLERASDGARFSVTVSVRPTPNPSFRRVDANVADGTVPVLRISTVVGRY